MGVLRVFRQIPNDDHYDRLVADYDALLEEDERGRKRIRKIERRFVEDDFTVQSGPRKGKPLTRQGRELLWGRLETLHWRWAWRYDELRRLRRIITGWSEHDQPSGDE